MNSITDQMRNLFSTKMRTLDSGFWFIAFNTGMKSKPSVNHEEHIVALILGADKEDSSPFTGVSILGLNINEGPGMKVGSHGNPVQMIFTLC